MIDLIKFIPPLHPEGYKFVLITFFVAILGSFFWTFIAKFALFVAFFCFLFFRNPIRVSPIDPSAVLSPADGLVTFVGTFISPKNFGLGEVEMLRVSIFLSVFDVHVNRIPFKGKVVNLQYYPGKFINASLDKSSDENEKQIVILEDEHKRKYVVAQIAGLIARRIVCNLDLGQEVIAGDEFGIIRFGSRVDLYLPIDYNIKVSLGQTMVGGETIIANASDPK